MALVTSEALLRHADIIARSDDPDTATALRWAANEIERLRAQLESLRPSVAEIERDEAIDRAEKAEAERDALREALHKAGQFT